MDVINVLLIRVGSFIGIAFDVDGALTGMKFLKLLEVVNTCITCVNFTTSSAIYTKILLELNKCLFDSNLGQTESLLQPYQVRTHGVVVGKERYWLRVASCCCCFM